MGVPVSDLGVLQYTLSPSRGSVSVEVFPANLQTYPPGLLQRWNDAANTRSSRARREVGNAALMTESENQTSQALQSVLKTFRGVEGDGKLAEAQNPPPLNEYLKTE
jgi:hypothetical protein